MQEMVGPNGFFTSVFGISALVSASLFIVLIGYIVLKDLPLMDKQGRYLSYFFTHRKREAKALTATWVIAFCFFVTTWFLSTL
ncbi:uncharacterized membrane protein (DUF485 family) [Sinorhizobium fredii]|uniref:hypothetical protein n=1 Tax=Rhizobium fredii TaxID=380 RepID=UPI0035153A09